MSVVSSGQSPPAQKGFLSKPIPGSESEKESQTKNRTESYAFYKGLN